MSTHRKPNSAECFAELSVMIPVLIVALAKEVAEETGEQQGAFECPLCRSGQVRWSVASNGHARARCARKCADGTDCVNAIE